jgi:hypothetical protein
MHRSIFVLLTLLLPSWFLLAQVLGSNSPSLPPGFIDGSKTPDLIPDHAAFRLVFLSLTMSASTQNAMARQDAFVDKVGLSDVDKATLKRVLITFASEHSALEQAIAAKGSGSPELLAQGWTIVQATRDLLTHQLTAEGNARLVQYVIRAKAHMRVRP